MDTTSPYALTGAVFARDRSAIREAMEATSFVDANGPRRITISIGVACLYPDGLQRPEQLVAMADEALYAAKGSGRNRVLAYQQEEGQHHG